MPLDINGYNASFKAFADFAAQSIEGGKSKAIARAGVAEAGPLAGRTITAATGDKVGKIGRSASAKDANNVARGLFKSAIIEMFGGESRIPASVKKAMLLSDYDCGKPLTARRIMAVKKAIDADGTARVKAAAGELGVELTSGQADEAVALFRKHGKTMQPWNAGTFAKFLVRLVAAGGRNREAIAADTAKSIRQWRNVSFGDAGLAAFNEAAKNYASNTIREYLQPAKATKFKDDIHDTMIADANRGTYILNGATYAYRSADELVPAFKAIVPDAKKQRALSTYLNQLCLGTIVLPSNHVPYDTGVVAHELPGFGALVNRDMTSGLYKAGILHTFGHGLTHDLKLSEDGKTATITQTMAADLSGPGATMEDPKAFGRVTLTQRLVIDLEPEIPVVADYQIAQTFA